MAAFGAANAAGLSWVEIATDTRSEVWGNPSGATGFVLTEAPDGGGAISTTVSLGYLTQATSGPIQYTFLGQESGFLNTFTLTVAPGTTINDGVPIGTNVYALNGAGDLGFVFEGAAGKKAFNGDAVATSSLWCSTCSIGLIATNRTYAGVTYEYIIGYNDSASPNLSDWDDMVIGVNAIPEPETYAMLLAGLGLMGFVARRRRKVAA